MFKEKAIKGLICLGVIGVLASSSWAVDKKPAVNKQQSASREQKGTQAVEAQAIEPKLIMEYKLPEGEEIVDVIFDEATMTVKEARALGVKGLEQKKATETVKVQYPKVVVLGKIVKYVKSEGGYPYAEDFEEIHPALIRFFLEKGKIKKEISLQKITPKGWNTKVRFSKNKKYIGILSNIYRYKEEKPSEAKFTMVDDEGKILWETDISQVGHGLPYISPNGQYIVCTGDLSYDYFDYMPSIWNDKGLVKKLFENEVEVIDLDFSKDGSWFAVAIETIDWGMETKRHSDRYRRHLIIFDDKGNELWRKENVVGGYLVFISKEDKTSFFTADYNQDKFKIYIFGKNGNLVETKDNVKEEYAKLLYIKKGAKLYGIKEEFYEKLDNKNNLSF